MNQVRSMVFVAMALLAVSSTVAAQSELERVEELARLARSDEARALLTGWWERASESASRSELQRALWLRGRLTVDPVQAELDFQRLAVLYPSGDFTPDAILRLAQASWATGDEEATTRYMATLDRDYPSSDARERAVAWRGAAGPLPPRGDVRTPSSQSGTAITPGAGARSASGQPVVSPPSGDRQTGGQAPAAAASDQAMYYVQLGAFGDEARAFALFDEARAAGVDARVVHVEGSNFTHVRVGRFPQREAAVEVREALMAKGINAALVRDERPETVVRARR